MHLKLPIVIMMVLETIQIQMMTMMGCLISLIYFHVILHNPSTMILMVEAMQMIWMMITMVYWILMKILLVPAMISMVMVL